MDGLLPAAQGSPNRVRPGLTDSPCLSGPAHGLEEGNQLTAGAAPVPEWCLCNSVSGTLAGYQIRSPAAQISLHMNNSQVNNEEFHVSQSSVLSVWGRGTAAMAQKLCVQGPLGVLRRPVVAHTYRHVPWAHAVLVLTGGW